MRGQSFLGLCVSMILISGCARSNDADMPTASGGPLSSQASASASASPEGAVPAAAAQPAAPQTPPPTPAEITALGRGWELVPEAQYAARQAKSMVTLVATGDSPTGGYEVKLVPS